MYKYFNMPSMQQSAENIDERMTHDANKSDFWRYGITVYVGSDPDVSGPSIVIDPLDTKGIEIFRRFANEMAEHYKTLNP